MFLIGVWVFIQKYIKNAIPHILYDTKDAKAAPSEPKCGIATIFTIMFNNAAIPSNIKFIFLWPFTTL